jgi:hypothetical protein
MLRIEDFLLLFLSTVFKETLSTASYLGEFNLELDLEMF